MTWNYVNDKLPECDGNYRVSTAQPIGHRRQSVSVRGFATNLYEVDKVRFQFSNHPGWYRYNDCDELVEDRSVVMWAEEMPGREE